jgi:hypothetical protein
MRKFFTAFLTLSFLAATGVAIFNGIIARPTNAYIDATTIASIKTVVPSTDATEEVATEQAVPTLALPTETPHTPAPSAVIVTATPASLEIGATAEGLPTAIILAEPYPAPPTLINDITIDSLVIIPDEETIRTIFALGQALGRDPRSFSKLGDSTIENPHFMARFDQPGTYNLGPYAYLQPMIDFYQGSFGRQGMAVHRGLHTWSVLDPMWADPLNCQPGENMLGCEIRQHNPSLIFIRLGSNDVGIPDSVDRNLREIVEFCIENGVIPIMGTKADRHEGGDNTNNNIIRQIAADYRVPLWDFDLIAATLPGRGMANDGVHLTTFFAHDYTLAEAFTRGYPVHNLTAMIMLDRVWRTVITR